MDCQITQGGVHFHADEETQYRVLLWTRLASRILLPIVTCKVYSDLDLYSAVVGQNWLDYFDEKPILWWILMAQTEKFVTPNLVPCESKMGLWIILSV